MSSTKIEQVTLFQIEKTSKVARLYSQRELDRLNISITVEQWIILKIIHEHLPISQKELAGKSLRDPASITRTLDLLEKKKLVKREAIPNNRRQYNVKLTAEGNHFIEQHLPLITGHRQKSTEGFTKEEIELLHQFLLRIQQNLK